MKKIALFLGIIFVATGFAFGTPSDSSTVQLVDTTRQTVITTINVDGLNYSFKNDTPPGSVKPLKVGTLKVSWDKFNTTDKFVGLRFRPLHTQEWTTVSAQNTDSSELYIKELDDNLIFEYQLGTGNAENVLLFETQIRHLTSFSPSLFKNNNTKEKEEEVEFFWGIERDLLNDIVSIYPNAHFVIKYNTKIGKERNAEDPTLNEWKLIEDISINKVKEKKEELVGGENYVYQIGLVHGDRTTWSKESSFSPERAWGIFKLLVLIGSLGLFIFGMKIMSEGLQKAAGARLRNMLGSITSNRISGVLTGFGITGVVQSSSVTTVMTVSFVNAGLLTLRQSAGVMMGANIGTTITAWLILLFGFKVSVEDYALIFIAIGAPLLFFSKGKSKAWASVIIGFSLLFMGLDQLKDAVPELEPDSGLVRFFIDFKDVWYGPVMFVALGTLVTIVIQSSSAAMALTMTLVAGNVIPFEVAAAMILGENIGTTITAELASLVGNVHAKRSARIHSLFNIIGVSWAILIFPYMLMGIDNFLVDGDAYNDGDAANIALAYFNSLFNLFNVLILLPFVPWLVRMAEKTVKSKGAADEEFHLDYIGSGIMGTPDLSIFEAKKEVAKFGELTSRMSRFAQELLTEQNKKVKSKLHEKMAKYEEITDRVEIEVATYLAKVSEGEMSEETAEQVRSMNSIVNDLERIGDIFYQISKAIERKDEHKIWFIPEQRDSLMEMFTFVDDAFAIMIENLNADWSGVSLEKANQAEHTINKKRDEMRDEHLENVGNTDFNMESGMIFNNLFSSCEKVGDHIINVSEAIKGKI